MNNRAFVFTICLIMFFMIAVFVIMTIKANDGLADIAATHQERLNALEFDVYILKRDKNEH